MNGTVLLVVLAALVVSARTRLNAVVLGQPVSVPALWLIAAAVVLALAGAVLWLLRGAFRGGGWRRLNPMVMNA